MPGSSLAGSVGASALGGGVQLSPLGACAAAYVSGTISKSESFSVIRISSIRGLSQFVFDEVFQLIGAVTRTFEHSGETSVAADNRRYGVVADGTFVAPVDFAEGSGERSIASQ